MTNPYLSEKHKLYVQSIVDDINNIEHLQQNLKEKKAFQLKALAKAKAICTHIDPETMEIETNHLYEYGTQKNKYFCKFCNTELQSYELS